MVVNRVGVAGVVAVFLAGAWLVAAPFAIGYQPPGAGWIGATKTDVITGGLLAVAGFAGLIAVIAGRVGEMYADARSAAALAASERGGADRRNTGVDCWHR
jgi:hypothetical protein